MPADMEKFLRDVMAGKSVKPTVKAAGSKAKRGRGDVYSDGKLAYVLKGSTPPARELLRSMFKTDRERDAFDESIKFKIRQGVIYGKRLLISQALGPSARLRSSNDNAELHQPANLTVFSAT